MTSERYKELIDELYSFKDLSYNWDGFGAVPVSNECIDKAGWVLKQLDSYSALNNVPDIEPAPSGSIIMVWESSEGGAISVSIGLTEMSYFVRQPYKTMLFANNKSLNQEEVSILAEYVKSF